VLGVGSNERVERASRGDLSVHFWNKGVLERVQDYNPLLVASDSFEGYFSTPGDYKELSMQTKMGAWFTLPGSPKEVSGKDHVYVVAGDAFGLHPEDLTKYPRLSAVSYAKEDLSMLLLGTSIAAGSLIASKKFERGSFGPMSRRTFFKKVALPAAAAVTALPFVRWGSAFGAGQTSEGWMHETFTKVAEATRHRFSETTWMDGRTALLISKAQTASISTLEDDESASVILGFPHLFNAENLLSSKKARLKAIRNYVNMLVDTLHLADVGVTPEEIKRDSAQYFRPVNILKVSEPAGDLKTIDQLVTAYKRDTCFEVEEALDYNSSDPDDYDF